MAKTSKPKPSTKQNHKISNKTKAPKPEKPASWAVVKNLFTCKHLQPQQQNQQPQNEDKQKQPQQQKHPQIQEIQTPKHQKHPLVQENQNQDQKQPQHQKLPQIQENQSQKQPQQQKLLQIQENQKEKQLQLIEENNKRNKKMNCSGSLCSNTKVMHRPETTSPENQKKRAAISMSNNNIDGSSSSRSMKTPLKEFNGSSINSTSSLSSPLRGIPFRKLSGCYECRMVVDPVLGFTKDPSLRATICSCPECGEIFMKPENLELHLTVKHAVSELGPEDTSKNIVEIIFQSSWLRKQYPVCKIDRILKIQNTPKTISKFEEYRDTIKAKASKLPKKHPRCIADGNELLRFHCTTFMCSLGLNGSSNLCNSIPHCGVCSIIKNGFKIAGESAGNGILTTATSGKAHDDSGVGPENEKRAMLVCRVIAGRVKKGSEGLPEEYDSVAGAAGVYANFDELYVSNPKAILPCFVVIYGGF